MNSPRNILLGVNVDHVATLRQARGTVYPDPLQAAVQARGGGADSITVHLREDRRHIQDHDVERIRGTVDAPLNLEMAATQPMQQFAVHVSPAECCLVPERRQELTTEGGLDVAARRSYMRDFCAALAEAGIRVSLFIDPDLGQVEAAADIGVPIVELHTGAYAESRESTVQQREWERLDAAVTRGAACGMQVNAGHGLHYENVQAIAAIPDIVCLNIGHAIVAEAVFDGMHEAVARMKTLMTRARQGGPPGF